MPSMTTRYAEMYLYQQKPNPKGPPKPKIDSASADGGGQVSVTFTKETTDPPIVSYTADGVSTGGAKASATIQSTKPPLIILTGLTVGENATITLAATNAAGESPESDPVVVAVS